MVTFGAGGFSLDKILDQAESRFDLIDLIVGFSK